MCYSAGALHERTKNRHNDTKITTLPINPTRGYAYTYICICLYTPSE